jgi:transglutaminase superfamily protein
MTRHRGGDDCDSLMSLCRLVPSEINSDTSTGRKETMQSDTTMIVEIDRPGPRARLEASAWGILCRIGIRVVRLDRLVGLLDRIPHRRSTDRPVEVPTARHFRGAGACLSRSLARSQYLRMRGASSTIAVGVAGKLASFDAHAWLEPTDPPDRPALHRIER